jgi:hypothetical protein
MLDGLPGLNRSFYEAALADLTSRQKPFGVHVDVPFISTGANGRSTVAFKIQSQDFINIRQQLVKIFFGTGRPFDVERNSFKPRLFVETKIPLKEANLVLENAQQDYKARIESVMALGLALRF